MIKMVVLDMAGTTVDENNVVYKTLRKAINEAGFDFSLEQVFAEGAGKEKFQAIKSVLSVFGNIQDESLATRIYERFTKLLADAYEDLEIFPQPHAEDLFRTLKARNIITVLNTGYNQKTAQSLIDKLGWVAGKQFDGLITASDVQNGRPEPDMIKLAMEQHGISNPSEVVKVGDSIIDIEEGKNAGCGLSIGITTGAHNLSQLESAKPDYVIGDLMELLPLLD